MMNSGRLRATRCAWLVAIVAVLAAAAPALAADPIFPVASRIGLVPPKGMVPAPTFEGFEDVPRQAAIILATFPSDAYGYLDKSMVPESLRKGGIDIEKREPMQVATGTGFLLIGKQKTATATFRKWMLVAPAGDLTALVTVQTLDSDDTYTDQMVRAALATLAVRASVPDAERLGLLPFTVGNLAGLRIDDVLPGRALMLVNEPAGSEATSKTAPDSNTDAKGIPVDARFLVAALPGGPTEMKDDDEFARVLFERIGGIRDVHVQDAEPLRIGGQPGYQTIAKAKDPQSDTDIMVVQWLRFGTGGFLQMIGIARADIWTDMLTRLRAVRDSVDAK